MSRRAAIVLAVLAYAAAGFSQSGPAFRGSPDHPAIAYSTTRFADAVSILNGRLEAGAARLTYDPDSGYLQSVLQALGVPKESQIAVFSPTSLQAEKIHPQNPRVVFFNDSVAVGWVRGGMIEVAAQDPRLGPVFYQLDQRPDVRPQFRRADRDCLECHRSWETLAVPGLFVLTTFPAATKNGYATGGVTDQRTPLPGRWAGWYVTGRPGANRHMGNKLVPTRADTSAPEVLDSLAGRFDLKGYPTPYSDIVALMVFEHQAHMTNLLTYINWESRVAEADRRGNATVREAARDLVDYMLFVDEAPLAGQIEGTSGFTQMFSAEGPRDARGRSLRQLDLQRRLMRYPCSFMIYSQAFDALPAAAKEAVYRRMWEILSGENQEPPYNRLSLDDRRAIVEILRETKKGLPDYFELVRN